MSSQGNKNVATALLIVFVLAIGGVLWVWVLAGQRDLSEGGDPPVSGGPPVNDSAGPKISFGVAPAPFSESLFVREQAHLFVEETAGHLIEKGLMKISEVLRFRKELEQADKLYQRGDYQTALGLYESIVEGIGGRLQGGEKQAAAEKLGEELVEKIRISAHLEEFAPAPWQAALEMSDEGTIAFKQAFYGVAAERFTSGLEQISIAEAFREQMIQRSVEGVQTSLEQLQLDAARDQIDQLANWDPEHPEISSLRSELETLEALLPGLRKGQELMDSSRFQEAMQHYEELLEEHAGQPRLEKRYQQARKAFLETRVRPLVAQAENLFQANQFDRSIELLEQALALAPGESDIAQAIDLVAQAIRQRDIDGALTRAYGYFEAREWQDAREAYQQVLEMDPENEEALKGSFEAGRNRAIEIRFSEKMAIAAEYAAAGRYPRSAKAFNDGLSIMPSYLKLTPEQEEIRRLLERQKSRVKVILRSDRDTWVSVIGVLPPEKFREKAIELYPDVYRFRGQRNGFQPVEFEHRIDADKTPIKIAVEVEDRR